MKRLFYYKLIILLFLSLPSLSYPAGTRGIQVTIKDKTGSEIDLYSGSHALIVGVSDYTAGWPRLESIPAEIMGVEEALAKNGFTVKRVLDPNSSELKNAFRSFIDRFGYNSNNRLLFFFSGHGYSRKNPMMGYLVPTDAPDPRQDYEGFLRKTVSMSQITTWCKEMEAKHVLFLFDSCFSGTIFKTRSFAQYPPHISDIIAKPVRQFITAGSAGEEVPAKSVFTPLFIRALRGEGDIDRDGYVTGTELGMYLHKQVLNYDTGQSPQYGKIKDPDLDEGDFVFQLEKAFGSKSPGTRSSEFKKNDALNDYQVGILKNEQQQLKKIQNSNQDKDINKPIADDLAAFPHLFVKEKNTKSLKIRVTPNTSKEVREVYKTLIEKKLGTKQIHFVHLPFSEIHMAIKVGIIDGVISENRNTTNSLKKTFPQGVVLNIGS